MACNGREEGLERGGRGGSRQGEGASAGQTGLITGLALNTAPGNLLLGLGQCLQLCLLQMECGEGCYVIQIPFTLSPSSGLAGPAAVVR